jgi:hypothetical protein
VNRRKFQRFMLRGPWGAQLRSCTEVTIDVVRTGQFNVISSQPAKAAELLTLELSSGRTCVDVQVVSSTPFFVDDTVFHRVRLQRRDQSAGIDAVAALSSASLARVVNVEVLEISRHGCLIESHVPLAEGSVGRLRVENDAGPFIDDVRISWSVRLKGAGSRCRAGAEVLTISRAEESSLHASLRTALPPPLLP